MLFCIYDSIFVPWWNFSCCSIRSWSSMVLTNGKNLSVVARLKGEHEAKRLCPAWSSANRVENIIFPRWQRWKRRARNISKSLEIFDASYERQSLSTRAINRRLREVIKVAVTRPCGIFNRGTRARVEFHGAPRVEICSSCASASEKSLFWPFTCAKLA